MYFIRLNKNYLFFSDIHMPDACLIFILVPEKYTSYHIQFYRSPTVPDIHP